MCLLPLPQTPIFLALRIQVTGMDFLDDLVSVRCPQIGGEMAGIDLHALRGKVLAHARHVAQEDHPRRRVRFGIHHLRKVDQGDVTVPVQDVVRRQIAVDPLVGEEQVQVKI